MSNDEALFEMVREIRDDVREVKRDVETVKIQHATAHSERMTLRRDIDELKQTKADKADIEIIAAAVQTEKQDRAEDRKALLKIGSIIATLVSTAVGAAIALFNWLMGS